MRKFLLILALLALISACKKTESEEPTMALATFQSIEDGTCTFDTEDAAELQLSCSPDLVRNINVFAGEPVDLTYVGKQMLGYTAESAFSGLYQPELSEPNICVFQTGDLVTIPCDDDTQQVFAENSNDLVWVHYYNDNGDIDIFEYEYGHGEYSNMGIATVSSYGSSGVFIDAKDGVCRFMTESPDMLQLNCEPELIYQLSDYVQKEVELEYSEDELTSFAVHTKVEAYFISVLEGVGMWDYLCNFDVDGETLSLACSSEQAEAFTLFSRKPMELVYGKRSADEVPYIVSYNATDEFTGRYDPILSKEDLCTFHPDERDGLLQIPCNDFLQQELSANAAKTVYIVYGNDPLDNRIYVYDYGFIEEEFAASLGDSYATGVLVSYDGEYCGFKLYDEKYSDFIAKCTENEANDFESYFYLLLYYDDGDNATLINYAPREPIPVMDVYFRGAKDGVCEFEQREGGNRQKMYCDMDLVNVFPVDEIIHISYIPNSIDDYPYMLSW